MIDPTLSSMNPSQPQETNAVPEVKDLKSKLPEQRNTGMSLLDIPIFPKRTSDPVSTEKTLTSQPSEQSLCEEPENPNEPPKYEYEFTNLWDGCLYSVYLYDTNDLSACERVLNRPVESSELSYSQCGNGFVVDGEFKYTFCKNPFRRIAASIVQPSFESKINRRTSIKVRTAEDILSSF
jgi:hypothetical protein